MERSACVARQKSTQELERLRGSLHDAIPAVEFEDLSKRPPGNPEQALQAFRGQAASWSAALRWATLERCGDGEVDGVSKFGSEE